MRPFIILPCLFLIASSSFAATPLLTFAAKTPTTISVTPSEMVPIVFSVTNQSTKSHTLSITPISGIHQTTTGLTTCKSPFTLGAHQSCDLILQVKGSELSKSISGGPVVCDTNSALQCYQPAPANILAVNLIKSQQLESSLTPLPFGFGALVYDANYSDGPGNPPHNEPGQWSSDLTAFNQGAAAKNQLSRVYPYSTDIEVTCTGTVTCDKPDNVNTCSIATIGMSSVDAYYTAMHGTYPNTVYLPIVDIAQNYLNNSLLLCNTTLADLVAEDIATQICSDPAADGIFFDLEVKGGLSNLGIVELYTKVSQLFATGSCVDDQHPNGRYMGVFITPIQSDWATAQTMFSTNNNSYFAIPLYDLSAFTYPPIPEPLANYISDVTATIKQANISSALYKVPYTIVVPAGASFGTFQEYGIYNADDPPTYFQLIKDYSTSNATQLDFVTNDRNIGCNQQNAYYMGMDYWSWQQYVNPPQQDGSLGPPYNLVMPNIPDSSTVSYLQKNAACQ